MKKTLLALAALCAPLAASADASWDAPSAPYRVVGNVYYVGTEGIGTYLIATPDGLILIDGATAKGASIIEANIRTLGFKLSDVKILLETHAHFDHVGGLAQLKADTGATLYASAGDTPSLEQGRHISDTDYGPATFAPMKVDRTLFDGSEVSLGGTTLTAHLTPGHTPGCTSWTLPVVEAGKAHRAIFYCSTSVGGNVLIGNKGYPSIAEDFRATFAKLRHIDADIFLVNHPFFADLSGKHQRQLAGDAEAFVVPGELQKFVAESEQDFEAEFSKQQLQQSQR